MYTYVSPGMFSHGTQPDSSLVLLFFRTFSFAYASTHLFHFVSSLQHNHSFSLSVFSLFVNSYSTYAMLWRFAHMSICVFGIFAARVRS